MTSNFGAVGFSNKDKSHITNEQDWTNVNEKGLSIYEKSKLLAEKAAWDYIDNNKTNLEFCVINPVAIFGPSLSKHISGSFELLESLLKGAPLPNISLNIVDVRDVATLHVNAMTCDKANHQRFIASCDGEISLSQIASIIRKHRGEYASSLRKSFLPNWAVFFASNFSRYASEGALMLKLNRHIDNSKAKLLLDWKPQFNNEDVVLASIDSMAKFGLLKEK
jgi:nucleoside-diphosphate-sugar epimerase